MKLLQKKLSRYDAPQKAKDAGVYPYFREISSDQDTEVLMHGKKVLMFGSNSYMGLTNHPKVKEAAIAATKKYGTGMAGSPFLNGTLDIHKRLGRTPCGLHRQRRRRDLFHRIRCKSRRGLHTHRTRRLHHP